MKTLGIRTVLVLLPLVLIGCSFTTVPSSLNPQSLQPPPIPEPTTPITEDPPLLPSAPSPPEQLLPQRLQFPDMIEKSNPSTELINRRYLWQYGGKEWVWEITIPQTLYDYYKEIPRPPTQNYSVYVTHPSDDVIMDALAKEINRIALKESFSALEKIGFATAFVQHLPYTVDSVTTPYDEYPRYPVETLVDNGGDCEDTTVLLASVLNSMGYEVILVVFPQMRDKSGHIGIGVSSGESINGVYFQYEGGDYYYIETTDTGWPVGEIPEALEGIQARLYGLTPIPILIHSWKEATGIGNILELEVMIENLGTAMADNVYILAGFDAGNDLLWNAEESHQFDLRIGQHSTVEFKLEAPVKKHTRIVVQIIDNGHAVDESYSEWFDTP